MTRICIDIDGDNGGTPTPSVRTYSTVVGDGAQSDFIVNHNLNTQGVFVLAYNVNTGAVIQDYELTLNDANRLTLRFDAPPAPNSVRVLVLAPVMSA